MEPFVLTLESTDSPFIFSLLQEGVTVRVRAGCSVKDILCNDLHIAPEYVEERIKTVFLNNRPVDDYENALVREGDRLALSAAMPGLVGATLRRGGVLSAFRSSITHLSEEQCESFAQGEVTIKLFNLLVREMAAPLLTHGIIVEGERLCRMASDLNIDTGEPLDALGPDHRVLIRL